jgi:hypothetical protein
LQIKKDQFKQETFILNSIIIMQFFASVTLALVAIVAGASFPEGAPMGIGVSCSGLDMGKLDSLSHIVLGQILEESYAEIEESSNSGNELEVSTDSVDVVDGRIAFYDQFWWKCRNCPPIADDELYSMFGNIRGGGPSKMIAWEESLSRGLVASRRSAFRTITKCKIALGARDKEIAA